MSSGPSTLIKDHLAGGASRLAALLLRQILPVFSVVAPCHPGAALRDLVLLQRGRATRSQRCGGEGMAVRLARLARATRRSDRCGGLVAKRDVIRRRLVRVRGD